MSMCSACERDRVTAFACSAAAVYIIDGREYLRVPFGKEVFWPADSPIMQLRRCRDCNVFQGSVHHVGCDVEECPNCHRQAITCGCLDEGDEDP